MKLQDYKKLMTRLLPGTHRRGSSDWRDCGDLCMDVIGETWKEQRKSSALRVRYEDLFKLCNWTYVKWSSTDKDDSNGETQEFCACVSEIWETIYNDGEQILPHSKMLDTLLEHLDGKSL